MSQNDTLILPPNNKFMFPLSNSQMQEKKTIDLQIEATKKLKNVQNLDVANNLNQSAGWKFRPDLNIVDKDSPVNGDTSFQFTPALILPSGKDKAYIMLGGAPEMRATVKSLLETGTTGWVYENSQAESENLMSLTLATYRGGFIGMIIAASNSIENPIKGAYLYKSAANSRFSNSRVTVVQPQSAFNKTTQSVNAGQIFTLDTVLVLEMKVVLDGLELKNTDTEIIISPLGASNLANPNNGCNS